MILATLPPEIIAAIAAAAAETPDAGSSLRALAASCMRLRRAVLRAQPALLLAALKPSIFDRARHPSANHIAVTTHASTHPGTAIVSFVQPIASPSNPSNASNVPNNLNSTISVDWRLPRYDALITLDAPLESTTTTTNARHRYVGLRKSGDRCCYSSLPLAMNLASDPSITNQTIGDPARCAYFEATVLEQPIDPDALHMRIGLVIAPALSDHEHPPGSVPASIGYRSCDGFIHIGDLSGDLFQFAPPWKVGDTVGCGIAPLTGSVFFTLNGTWVGDVPAKISLDLLVLNRPWHAAISAGGRARFAINFGAAPFAFNLAPGSISPVIRSRLRSVPDPHELAIANAAAKSSIASTNLINPLRSSLGLCMVPNILPPNADPYLPPNADPYLPPIVISQPSDHPDPSPVASIIQFPDNGPSISRSCLSNIPLGIHPNCFNATTHYFEVTVLESQQQQHDPTPAFFSIGIASRPYSPFHQIGWNPDSIALHSDDANVFSNSHQSGIDIGAPLFGSPGTVIGCGFIPQTKSVFFTVRGVRFDCPDLHIKGLPYAAIAALRSVRLAVNFGQLPFSYAPANTNHVD